MTPWRLVRRLAGSLKPYALPGCPEVTHLDLADRPILLSSVWVRREPIDILAWDRGLVVAFPLRVEIVLIMLTQSEMRRPGSDKSEVIHLQN